MKKILMKLRGIKIKRKLTNEEKVDSARNKIESAFSMFKEINDDIEEANKVLKEVIESETVVITEAERNRDNAHDEISMNKALQERLSHFIVDDQKEQI